MSNQQVREAIRISTAEARERYDQGDVTVLDVVDSHVYDNYPYQVQGALRIKPEDIPDEFSRLPEDLSVLTY